MDFQLLPASKARPKASFRGKKKVLVLSRKEATNGEDDDAWISLSVVALHSQVLYLFVCLFAVPSNNLCVGVLPTGIFNAKKQDKCVIPL